MSSPTQQIERIARRKGEAFVARPFLLHAARRLESSFVEAYGEVYCDDETLPYQTLVVFVAELNGQIRSCRARAYNTVFQAAGKAGLEETRGQPDWLKSATATSSDGRSLFRRVVNAVRGTGTDQELWDLLDDVAYVAAQRRLLRRIGDMSWDHGGAIPAVLLAVWVAQGAPGTDAKVETELVVLSLPPALPKTIEAQRAAQAKAALPTTAKMGA